MTASVVINVVNAAPISEINITGFLAIRTGFSISTDRMIEGPSMLHENSSGLGRLDGCRERLEPV